MEPEAMATEALRSRQSPAVMGAAEVVVTVAAVKVTIVKQQLLPLESVVDGGGGLDQIPRQIHGAVLCKCPLHRPPDVVSLRETPIDASSLPSTRKSIDASPCLHPTDTQTTGRRQNGREKANGDTFKSLGQTSFPKLSTI